jgi:hypothetical protein
VILPPLAGQMLSWRHGGFAEGASVPLAYHPVPDVA